jgi:uncharacterized protein DUF4404
MAEQEQAASTSAVANRLHEVARLLRGAHHLGVEARQSLAEMADELAERIVSAPMPPAAEEHLAQTAERLVEVLHHKEEGPLAAARDRLEEAVLAAKDRAPVIAGLASQLLDALAKIGI